VSAKKRIALGKPGTWMKSQGVVANTLNTFRNGAACRLSSFTLVGFIDGLNAKRRIQDNTFLVPPGRAKRSPEYVAVASCTQCAYKRGSWPMSQLKSMRQNQRNQITPLSTNPKTAPKRKAHPKLKTNFARDLANREEDQDWMMDLPSNEKRDKPRQ